MLVQICLQKYLIFRLNYISILTDIKQAFLNVETFAEHEKFLKFLLLNGIISHHFLKYEPAYPKFVEKFLEDLYVDDSTLGASTVTEGKEFYDLT